jgi:hypothetical protein
MFEAGIPSDSTGLYQGKKLNFRILCGSYYSLLVSDEEDPS